MLELQPHPIAAFWLDVADKAIKLSAVFIGGLWTWWNYRKGRTYSQRLDLKMDGEVFFRGDLYIDIDLSLKNLGAAKHSLQPEGTSCDLVLVHSDLREEIMRIFPVFILHTQIEPGETISDRILWRIEAPSETIVWIRVNLRVVSGRIEWNKTAMVRVSGPMER